VSAYALALAALIPTGGALGDHFGRKRIFFRRARRLHACLSGLRSLSFGCGTHRFPGNPGDRWRHHVVADLSLIAEAYPPEARTGPIGLWTAVSGLAVAAGSVAGGLLLSVFPWSSIFWVNVPIGVVTFGISRFAVAESRESVPRPFDTGGVALSTSGLLLLTFGFIYAADATWRSPPGRHLCRRWRWSPGGLLRLGAPGRVPVRPGDAATTCAVTAPVAQPDHRSPVRHQLVEPPKGSEG
jgi:MFS family permease